MRRSARPARWTAAVAVLGVVGLLVSMTALVASWPRSDTSVPDALVLEAGPPARPDDARHSSRPDRARGDRGTSREQSAGDRGKSERQVGRSAAALDASPPGGSGSSPLPAQVALPAVGYDAPVRPVGVADDGQMQLPANPEVLGWYRFGPAPGSGRGSVVLAGHLDSRRFGLGPLVTLRTAEVGDRVRVTNDNGRARSYEIQAVRRFDRQGLPDRIFDRSGPERLHLITCGGAYDPDAGGYQQNLVVTAVPL